MLESQTNHESGIRRSGLHSVYRTGSFGAPETPGVTFTELRPASIFLVSAWPGTLASVEHWLFGQISADLPGGTEREATRGCRELVVGAQGQLMRTEPLKWLMLDVDRATLKQNEFAIDLQSGDMSQGTLVDQSHALVALGVSGPCASVFLNRLIPLQLSRARSATGSAGWVATTVLHHVAVTLSFDGQRYALYLPRSFATALYEVLFETALQFGLEVAPPESPVTAR